MVKVWRRTETGEAPRGQGATTENTGLYLVRHEGAEDQWMKDPPE